MTLNNGKHVLRGSQGQIEIFDADKGLPLTTFEVSEYRALVLALSLIDNGSDTADVLQARIDAVLEDAVYRHMEQALEIKASVAGVKAEPYARWELELLYSKGTSEYWEALQAVREYL